MTGMSHGVVVTEGRAQPFAVWVRGQIVLFTHSRCQADRKLKAEETRLGGER